MAQGILGKPAGILPDLGGSGMMDAKLAQYNLLPPVFLRLRDLGPLVPSVLRRLWCPGVAHPLCFAIWGLKASVHTVPSVPLALQSLKCPWDLRASQTTQCTWCLRCCGVPGALSPQSQMPSVLIAPQCFNTLGASEPWCSLPTLSAA
ncbi:UNVERIFIED_CONTAM: hypothetical protein FKN15_075070 [Acipenser sinensis]